MVFVKRTLRLDLERLQTMAFRHSDRCGSLLKDFHANRARINSFPGGDHLWKIYDWLLAPLSLWPMDFAGLAKFLLNYINTAKAFDEELALFLQVIDQPPDEATQKVVREFEPDVELGRYEKLIRRPEKFAELETNLLQDETLSATWLKIKKHHDPQKYQNTRGVIRRRLSQERNLREGWDFDWSNEKKRFYAIFDILCHRWRLYGIQNDTPLLLKISVNPTPHGTMIVIPRDWSLDPARDLNWSAINKIHRAHGPRRQGPQFSAGRIQQHADAIKAKKLWAEALGKGLHGDDRYEYVCEHMKKDVRTDSSWLKRLLRIGKKKRRINRH